MGRGGRDDPGRADPRRPGPETEPDFWGLLQALSEHEVEFVVIGGFAVSLQGYVRTTKDVDIVPSPDPANLARLWDAVSALGARPANWDDFKPDELPAFTLEGFTENGGNWMLYTRLGRLDLMPYVEDLDGELPYATLRAEADTDTFAEAGDQRIWFASVRHLISMKKRAGRDEDLLDVTALRRAHGLEDD
jgi:hypothetical protein